MNKASYFFFKKLLSFSAFFCALFLVMHVSSCKKEKKMHSKSLKEEHSPLSTLRLYTQSEPLSLDPRIGGNRASQVFIRQLFEGLTRIHEDGKPHLACAKSCEISQDGLTYTFKLGKNLWSNGEKVTAYDFEYAWKSLLNPQFPSMYGYAFYIIQGAKEAHQGTGDPSSIAISCPDENTLICKLTHPAPYFLELLANPLYSPVPRAIASQQKWNGKVSNGPFIVQQVSPHKEFTFVKNPHYRDKDHVHMDVIHVSLIQEPETALHLFEKDELDIVGEPFGTINLEALPKLTQKNQLNIRHTGALYWLETNTKNKLLSSKKIRTALAIAIKRKEITDSLLQSGEKPAFSILPDELSLVNEPNFTDGDPEKAKMLFEEGLKELNLTRETLDPLVITYWAEAKERAIAQIIASTWTKVFAIPVTLTSCDWTTYLKKVSSSDYDIAGGSWYTWYQDPIYNLEFMKFIGSGLNGTNWQNERYIELLDKSDHALDPQLRYTYLKEAERLIMSEMPIIPLFSQTYKYVQNPKLKGVYLTPVGMLELKHAYFTQDVAKIK
jgi:oligopeptide transport system substrate-binding protein